MSKCTDINNQAAEIAQIFGNTAEDIAKYSVGFDAAGLASGLNCEEDRIAEIFGNSADDTARYGK